MKVGTDTFRQIIDLRNDYPPPAPCLNGGSRIKSVEAPDGRGESGDNLDLSLPLGDLIVVCGGIRRTRREDLWKRKRNREGRRRRTGSS